MYMPIYGVVYFIQQGGGGKSSFSTLNWLSITKIAFSQHVCGKSHFFCSHSVRGGGQNRLYEIYNAANGLISRIYTIAALH